MEQERAGIIELFKARRTHAEIMKSMRKMALDLKISDFSIRKVVRTDLGMRSYKRKKVHFLSGPVKEKRLLRGELGKHASRGLENILFSEYFPDHEKRAYQVLLKF